MVAVLITGTSTGIGRETALRLARSGYRVFASVRGQSDGEALRRVAGESLVPISLDVTDAISIERALTEIETRLDGSGLCGLVNNAGIAVFGPLEYVTPDDLRRPFDVNVFGTTALTQAALPLLRAGRGRLINVSSGSGRVSAPLMGPYSASKFALEALSDALRAELRSFGIDVVLIEPGGVRTPLIEKEQAQIRETIAKLPERGRALYGAMLDRFLATHARMGERTATTPEAVASVIQRALEARRPKTRYAVGTDMHAIRALRWLLPDRAVDAVFVRMFGL